MHRHDVRMIEARGGPRFLLETLASDRIGGHVTPDHFQRDSTTQPRVLRLVHFAHTASAEGSLHDIVTQP